MKYLQMSLMAGLALVLPFVAAAEQDSVSPSEIRYCHELARTYLSLWPAMEGMPVADAVASNQCDFKTRSAIATLEEKLQNKKIALPSHNSVAHEPASGHPER